MLLQLYYPVIIMDISLVPGSFKNALRWRILNNLRSSRVGVSGIDRPVNPASKPRLIIYPVCRIDGRVQQARYSDPLGLRGPPPSAPYIFMRYPLLVRLSTGYPRGRIPPVWQE